MPANSHLLKQATGEAFADWLDQHEITVPEAIEAAVEKAFTRWLTAHTDDLVTAIAEAVARRQHP
ncbi:hypothetical protein RKE29_02160 [Streptomyces sp. B1866]|uniref:hypothetical protein n=1 Tax=Streptomyces sp. B1866 TaxID=3075431 RepID=UPI002890FDBC|nr:hypothetical protein [Streptomyces sp. B1866]MDT3395465.1 hypothetical protein [Streptomyces sp. B1866]